MHGMGLFIGTFDAGISKGSWFFWGLQPRAEVSTEAWGNDTDRINEEGNIQICRLTRSFD